MDGKKYNTERPVWKKTNKCRVSTGLRAGYFPVRSLSRKTFLFSTALKKKYNTRNQTDTIHVILHGAGRVYRREESVRNIYNVFNIILKKEGGPADDDE